MGRTGRPRKYATNAERQAAYRRRKKAGLVTPMSTPRRRKPPVVTPQPDLASGPGLFARLRGLFR